MLAAIVAGGCLGPTDPIKSGATEIDLRKDEAECRTLALHRNEPASESEPAQLDVYALARDTRLCMEARGWHFPPGWR